MSVRTSAIRAAVALTALAALPPLAAGPARAQPPANRPFLFLSTNPAAPADFSPAAPIQNVLLRPNVEEPLYLYVRNPTNVNHQLTVLIGNGPDDADAFAQAAVTAPPGQTVRVRPPRPKEEPPVVTPPGAKPVPLPVTALPRGLYLRLADANGVIERLEFPVRVRNPSDYVVAAASFEGEPGSLRNRLRVTLSDRTPDRPFTGPPAKVRLDLSPARVPGLVLDSLRGGTYLGELRPGGSVTLVAANLRFTGPDHRGIVAIDVDNYERAFLFQTDFSGTVPQPVTNEILLRLAGPRYAIPGQPCPIPLQVDNPPSDDVIVEFGIDRANTGEYVVSRHAGDRLRRPGARWDGTVGGLVFVSTAHDWIEELDTAGMFGPRKLRLRLLDRAGTQLAPPVFDDIVLDDTPPQEVRVVPAEKPIRNRLIDVKAYGVDPESGVARVVFFMGEPPAPDGKPAPGSVVVEGTPPAAADGPYTAQFRLPDRVGRASIGARFINRVALAKDAVAEVEVADPPAKPTTGSIKVTVVSGSPTVPQPGVEVQLRDAKNAVVLRSGAANDKGVFTFEDLPPGPFVVYSSRPRFYTKAQKPVSVEVGKTVEVTLDLRR